MAIRAAMHQVGASFLQKLLELDTGHRGSSIECGNGHQVPLLDYRTKQLTTVLGNVKVRRAYYHCSSCKQGVIPKDLELDIVGTSFSPGVRRLMARVGGKEPFAQCRQDLEDLAGITLNTKAVERVSKTTGAQVENAAEQERQALLSGKMVLLHKAPIPKLYVAIDGTGVPMVPQETQGRAGKGEDGKAKTREAKLGCVFTQTTLGNDGHPLRDPASTTFVGSFSSADAFGSLIYAETLRRGLEKAELVDVLGDGAPWIWNIADEQFPGAIQTVDLYHAREHLANISKLIFAPVIPNSKDWLTMRYRELDAGSIEDVLRALESLQPEGDKTAEEVRKAAGYFKNNAKRMRYAHFRSLDLFVGSGVVEAGCKTVIGQRLKLSGMHWSIQGAEAIVNLRCCDFSGRLEDFWAARSAG